MGSRTAPEPWRLAFVAASTLAVLLVLAGWVLLLVAAPAPGDIGAGDLLLLAAVVPAGVALLIFPGAPDRAAGRGRTVVDGLIVATAALATAWAAGLDDRFHAGAGSDYALAVLHALGLVAVAAMAIVMLTRAPPDARRTLALATAGLGALAVADAALVWVRLGGDIGLGGAATVAALSGVGVLVVSVRTASGSGPGLPTRASVYIPSVPLAVGLVALAAEAVREGRLSDVFITLGVALVVLVIARQIYALLENIAFWRDLEATIAVQTDELKRSEARFRSLVQNSSDVITVVTADGLVGYQSPSIRHVFGHRPEALQDRGLAALVAPGDLASVFTAFADLEPGATRIVTCGVVHADGRPRRAEIVVTNRLEDPDVEGYVLNARDDTERRALEEQLTHMAFHDPLTDLANRALFRNRVEHALARRRPDGLVGALFIDLDDFKNVNDSLGHAVGDELLVLVAERLRRDLRPGDTVGRLGGDEFAVLLEDIDDELQPVRAAERILQAMGAPFVVGGRTLHSRASIGIATASVGTDSAGDLLRNADTAMYTAKARGKGRYARFDGDMHGLVARRMELEADLRAALERDELAVAYQPIFSLRTGSLTGFEALARWNHPVHGPVGPDEFIRVAEESGLILDLGRWVMTTAMTQARDWGAQYPERGTLEMSVNVSARQVRQPDVVTDVLSTLAAIGVDPACLVVELTETMLMDDTEPTIEKLQQLRGRGVKVAIDDFGTGYSSLSYLVRLPVDKLKIDRSFVVAMGAGAEESALVQAIVTMGHLLGLTIVAEGIETQEQHHALKAAGSDLGQGYRLGRPVSAALAEQWLVPEAAAVAPAEVD